MAFAIDPADAAAGVEHEVLPADLHHRARRVSVQVRPGAPMPRVMTLTSRASTATISHPLDGQAAATVDELHRRLAAGAIGVPISVSVIRDRRRSAVSVAPAEAR